MVLSLATRPDQLIRGCIMYECIECKDIVETDGALCYPCSRKAEGMIPLYGTINLTQHNASPDQLKAGVHDCPEHFVARMKELLTFSSLPSKEEIEFRAKALANIALHCGASQAMIGGAPYLMSALEEALKNNGISPVYAYSERVSEEIELEDGSVVKRNVFKHLGFVEV